MARRRHHKKGSGMWGILNKVLPALAFVSQATIKEKASYATLPTLEKLKAITNNLTGNAFGLNLFGGTTPQFTEKFNPAGIANKYTGIGIAGLILKVVSKRLPAGAKVPYLGRITTLATRFLPAGILGGIIDAPDTVQQTSQQFSTYVVPMAPYDSTRLSS